MKFTLIVVAGIAFAGPVCAQTPGTDSLAHFRAAEALLVQNNYQSAATEFASALEGNREPAWTEVWSHINLGRIFDITGQCDRALSEYGLALNAKEVTQPAKDEIEVYLNSRAIRSPDTQSDPADQLDPPPGVQRPGNGVTTPELIQTQKPGFSTEARIAGLEGRVTVVAVIDEDGQPRNIRVVQPLGYGLDEKAVDAVRNWRFKPGTFEGRPVPVFTSLTVWFIDPARDSRWHLVGAAFEPAPNTVRPKFAKSGFPPGAGVRVAVIEDARIVAAVGRFAGVTLAFDIDEHGIPLHFKVLTASQELWGNEAIAVARNWRFTPATREAVPVSVGGTVNLFWGARTLTPEALHEVRAGIHPESARSNSCIIDVPALLDSRQPVYTEQALKAGLEGKVMISLVIPPSGEPHDLQIVGAPLGMGLDNKAMETVATWRFRPSKAGGNSRPVPALVEVDFHLPSPPVPPLPPPPL
jgi:TonB family protein